MVHIPEAAQEANGGSGNGNQAFHPVHMALSQGDLPPARAGQATGLWAWLPGADKKGPRKWPEPLPGPGGPTSGCATKMTAASLGLLPGPAKSWQVPPGRVSADPD